MTTETDIRLRSQLDSNQRDREQMCRAVLALNQKYTGVRPRHPLGGPDGGRDIEAFFEGDQLAFGAVGFANSANDSAEQKKVIKSKFDADLKAALAAETGLKVFTFFTNVHLTVGEKDAMRAKAQRLGVTHCEIIDRERLRIELDSPQGFFIRFQYLGIALSEAEQASFLARYGEQLQELMGSEFQRMESKLDHILFLQEANEILDTLLVVFQLDRQYSAEEIGHFRAFVSLSLREIKHEIFRVFFGSTDRSCRFYQDEHRRPHLMLPGIENGIASGQWEHRLQLSADDNGTKDTGHSIEKYVCTGSGSAVGQETVSSILARYSHDNSLIRFQPRLQLRDLDACMFILLINRSLAEKIQGIHVYANGYKLMEVQTGSFSIDVSRFENDVPIEFYDEELADGWVRIRPTETSAFRLRFNEQTPKRLFSAEEIQDTQPN